MGDFENLDAAVTEARARATKYGGGGLTRYHVYNDRGQTVFSTR